MPLFEKLLPSQEALMEETDTETEADYVSDDEISPVEAVYFVNKTDLPIENLDEFIASNPAFSDMETEYGSLDYEDWEAAQNNHLGDYKLYVSMEVTDSGISFICEAPLKSFLEREDLELFEYRFAHYLELKKLEWSGLSASQMETFRTPVNGSISQLDENGEPVEDVVFNNSEYWTSYGIIILSIFIIALSAEGIAVSVLTEKSSKIVEYLMMSVKPMALIVGKTLAMLCTVLVQFIALFAGLLLSCFLNGYLVNETFSFTPAASMEQFLSLEIFHAVNPGIILLSVIILVAGVIFYCTLAGVAGASVSRMEEIGEASKLYNIVMIIGAYFGLFVAISSSASELPVVNYIAYLLPLSSPFILPVHLILGKVSPLIGCISLAILILFIALAFLAASRIYANMLFYSGKPMKLKNLIQFIKNSRKEAE